MHQIRFRLGLHPRPRSQCSPKTPCSILGGPSSKGREEGEKGRAQERRGEVKGGGAGKEGTKEERGGKGHSPGRRGFHPIEISGYATVRLNDK